MAVVIELDVIDRPEAAVAALDPVRARILAELAEPGSASTVAAALGLGRQQVNYHLRALEQHGLVELLEERPRRGLTERVMQATARSYVLATPGLGRDEALPERTDRLSARYLIALAARLVREVGDLARRADQAGKPLATLAIDTEIRFASAADRAAFTRELAEAVAHLVGKYHDEAAPAGRWHRLIVAAHPRPPHPPPPHSPPPHRQPASAPGSAPTPAPDRASTPDTAPEPPPEPASTLEPAAQSGDPA